MKEIYSSDGYKYTTKGKTTTLSAGSCPVILQVERILGIKCRKKEYVLLGY